MKKGVDRLVPCWVATNLEFVKNAISVKCHKVKHNKMRYVQRLRLYLWYVKVLGL